MSSTFTRLVAWIRAGYPTGVPDRDFLPLLALLRRRLSDAEVIEVETELVNLGVIAPDRVDIGVEITKVTDELPTQDEVNRVANRLIEHGWPVDLGNPL